MNLEVWDAIDYLFPLVRDGKMDGVEDEPQYKEIITMMKTTKKDDIVISTISSSLLLSLSRIHHVISCIKEDHYSLEEDEEGFAIEMDRLELLDALNRYDGPSNRLFLTPKFSCSGNFHTFCCHKRYRLGVNLSQIRFYNSFIQVEKIRVN